MRSARNEPLEWMFDPFPPLPAVAPGGYDVNGDEFIAVPYSQVRSWAAPNRRLTQDEMEIWHLAQINADHFSYNGIPFVPAGWRKNERHVRPDFMLQNLRTGEFSAGLELAQFAPEERREVEATAIRLRARISQHACDFCHLAGCRVTVAAARGQVYDSGPPALNRELKNIGDVIAAIAALQRPNSLAFDYSSGQLPEDVFTQAQVGNVVAHCQEHVSVSDATGHYLYRDPIIHLAFTAHETIESIGKQIKRIVSKHDYEEANALVITAGAPDRLGYGYIEDEMLLDFYLSKGGPMDVFEGISIKQVVLHRWSNGAIRQVFPEEKALEDLPTWRRVQTIVAFDEHSGQTRGFRPGAYVL